MATDKKNGMPSGIFRSTVPPESGLSADEGQGDVAHEETATSAKPAKGKARARKPVAAAGADRDGWKLYLSEDVRFRLRMLAFKRGQKLSTVANEVLDKALPRWTLERAD